MVIIERLLLPQYFLPETRLIVVYVKSFILHVVVSYKKLTLLGATKRALLFDMAIWPPTVGKTEQYVPFLIHHLEFFLQTPI